MQFKLLIWYILIYIVYNATLINSKLYFVLILLGLKKKLRFEHQCAFEITNSSQTESMLISPFNRLKLNMIPLRSFADMYSSQRRLFYCHIGPSRSRACWKLKLGYWPLGKYCQYGVQACRDDRPLRGNKKFAGLSINKICLCI